MILNEDLIGGWQSGGVDLEDPDAVFWHVFKKLPDEVTVYPSENYYYWRLFVDGREIWGNIRLPAGRRERGVVSFGYSEFVEFPNLRERKPLSRSKYFTKADGVDLTEVNRFTYSMKGDGKEVVFRLNELSQEPPSTWEVREGEVFVQRTFDESGLRFFLMFNAVGNYFFWVLNEEEGVAEQWKVLGDGVVRGRRSGFVFWQDGKRKVLATIRKLSVRRNDYYDGPFDQLADNYADETKVQAYMLKALPGLVGRIDKYGYYTDKETPMRVALSNYGTYYTDAEALKFVETAVATGEPHRYISRGGVPERKVEKVGE